jgi:hypothetical protein
MLEQVQVQNIGLLVVAEQVKDIATTFQDIIFHIFSMRKTKWQINSQRKVWF